MARYVKDLPLVEDPNSSFAAIYQYLTQDGFVYEEYKGEQVFRKGSGWVSCPTFIKVSYAPNMVRLEAWIKYAILPGVYAGEMGMEGFAGSLAKGTMRRCAAWVEQRLGGGVQPMTVPQPQQGYGDPSAPNYAAQYPTPAMPNPDMPKPIPYGQQVSLSDYRCHYASEGFKKSIRICAILCYVMCGINLLLALLEPVYLLDVAIQLGLTLGLHLKKSKGCAIAMIVYAAISMILGLINAGMLTGWLWLILGIAATNTINNVDKEYNDIMNRRNSGMY